MNDFNFPELYRSARESENGQLLIEAFPYAQFLGMKAQYDDGELSFHLPPLKSNIGNPNLPALHGGAIGGFMEVAAVVYLLMSLDQEKILGTEPKIPKVVDFSIDYLRACRFEDTYASCEVVRQGRRMANVAIRVWQSEPSNITATARAHYVLA